MKPEPDFPDSDRYCVICERPIDGRDDPGHCLRCQADEAAAKTVWVRCPGGCHRSMPQGTGPCDACLAECADYRDAVAGEEARADRDDCPVQLRGKPSPLCFDCQARPKGPGGRCSSCENEHQAHRGAA